MTLQRPRLIGKVSANVSSNRVATTSWDLMTSRTSWPCRRHFTPFCGLSGQQRQAFDGFPTYSGCDRVAYGLVHKNFPCGKLQGRAAYETPRISCIRRMRHHFDSEVMPKIDPIPEAARYHASCIAGHNVDDLMTDKDSEVC
jgi:hypothetical protein